MVARRTDFADPSPEGVAAPAAPKSLSSLEANSPARRSPQVRRAQALGSRRADRVGRAPADTP